MQFLLTYTHLPLLSDRASNPLSLHTVARRGAIFPFERRRAVLFAVTAPLLAAPLN